jgi:hypothetical protein
MKKSQYGACGLYCGACGARDCEGCRSDRVDETAGKCKFRRCSREKTVEFCYFCGEYPCKELAAFMYDEWPHHWTMEPNLEYVRAHGKQKWLQAQEEQWSCPNCGAQTFWYQKSCTCGQPLDAWDLPAC